MHDNQSRARCWSTELVMSRHCMSSAGAVRRSQHTLRHCWTQWLLLLMFLLGLELTLSQAVLMDFQYKAHVYVYQVGCLSSNADQHVAWQLCQQPDYCPERGMTHIDMEARHIWNSSRTCSVGGTNISWGQAIGDPHLWRMAVQLPWQAVNSCSCLHPIMLL